MAREERLVAAPGAAAAVKALLAGGGASEAQAVPSSAAAATRGPGRRRVWSPSATLLGVVAMSGGVGWAHAFCPGPAAARRPGQPAQLC